MRLRTGGWEVVGGAVAITLSAMAACSARRNHQVNRCHPSSDRRLGSNKDG
jgi:hypothetical protein